MALMSKPTHDPKLTRWWWRTLREWVYELIDPLWATFRGENSDDIALANVTGINDVSASELAVLDGLTATNTELNKLSGLTADASELNKADRTQADGLAESSRNVVLDVNKDILGKRYDINRSLLDALAGKPLMRFDGSNDYVNIGDVTDLEFGTSDLSILVVFKAVDLSSNCVLVSKDGGSSREFGFSFTSVGELEFAADINGGVLHRKSNTGLITAGNIYVAVVTLDQSEEEVAFYLNGAQKAIVYSSGSLPNAIPPGNGEVRISGRHLDASYRLKGDIYKVLAFNRLFMADEVKTLTSGAPVAFADVGANMAGKVTNGEDWTGASGTTPPNNWSDVGAGTATYIIRNNTGIANFGDDKALELSASGGSKTLYQGAAQAGKRYRVSFVYRNLDGTTSSYVALGSDDNKVTLQNTGISGDGVVFEQELVADGANLKFFVDGNGTLQIDHVQLTQVGCVAAYLPDGITHAQWQDAGGNNLHGAVNGALPMNLPSNHVARHIKPGITGDTTLTDAVPAGYRIKSMVADVTGAGAGMILNIGTSAGGTQVINGQDISANGLFDLTVTKNIFSLSAAQSLYVNDDGGTAWSGVSVDLYIETERVK